MSARVHATALIEDGALLGDDVEVGPYCVIGPQARIGDGCRLISHVSVTGDTVLGPQCLVYPFAALGGPPQSRGYKPEHVTRLEIGARNVIREHVTMQSGTEAGGGLTQVGSDGYFMVGAHVAHDCTVGDRVTFANNATLGGHAQIADGANLGGACVIHQFTRIGRSAMLGGAGALAADLIPFGMAFGNHASLQGLNLIGLERMGCTRETIKSLRAAHKRLFLAEDGTFRTRLEEVARDYADVAEVAEIVAFIRAADKRPILMAR